MRDQLISKRPKRHPGKTKKIADGSLELKIRPILMEMLGRKFSEKEGLHRRGMTYLEVLVADLITEAVGKKDEKARARILDQIEGRPGRQDTSKTIAATNSDDMLAKQMKLLVNGGDEFDRIALDAEERERETPD